MSMLTGNDIYYSGIHWMSQKLNRWTELGLSGGRIINPYKSPATKIGSWLLMIS